MGHDLFLGQSFLFAEHFIFTYREDGLAEKVTYVDIKDKPMEIGKGYCSIVMVYEEDQQVAQQFVNLKGEIIAERKTALEE